MTMIYVHGLKLELCLQSNPASVLLRSYAIDEDTVYQR